MRVSVCLSVASFACDAVAYYNAACTETTKNRREIMRINVGTTIRWRHNCYIAMLQ